MAETEDATEAPGESELASGRKPRGRRRRPATGLQRGRRANRISAAEGGARRSGIGAEQSRERERERRGEMRGRLGLAWLGLVWLV